MPWSGAGVVSLTQDFPADVLAGSPDNIIDADKMDDVLEDLANCIEACLNRNGENAIAANISWGGFRITSLGAATSVNDGVRARQVAENALQYGGSTGGSSNAYTVTNSFISSVGTGTRLLVLPNHTCSGASTLAINGGSAIAIKAADGSTALVSGDITSGRFCELVYDGTVWRLVFNSISYQPLDATLTALAGVTTASDKLIYASGSDTFTTTDLTSFARTLLDDASSSAARSTLGLGALAVLATVGTSTIDDASVTYAKIQDVSATDKILGRSSSGSGDVEEITCTSAGRALIDDADAAAQRTTLGLGTAALKATGTSGNNVPLMDGNNSYSGQQNFAIATLTDGASIAWNLNTQQVAVVTLGGNRALAAPSNQVAGGTYVLIVKQDGTGSRTLSFDSTYKFPGGVDPTLSTGASDVDVLSFVSDGTSMYGVASFDFS